MKLEKRKPRPCQLLTRRVRSYRFITKHQLFVVLCWADEVAGMIAAGRGRRNSAWSNGTEFVEKQLPVLPMRWQRPIHPRRVLPARVTQRDVLAEGEFFGAHVVLFCV